MSRVVVIQGHPDKDHPHLCHALAAAYAEGARSAGHGVDIIDVAALDFSWLRTREAFEHGSLPPVLQSCQQTIRTADHLLIVYPLWLGSMPALLKAFFEQVFRPGFAFAYQKSGFPEKKLKGKSARIVITMGMPALAYRWYFGAHSLKSLERNILRFCGIGPIRESLFGMVETASEKTRQGWLAAMRAAGRHAA